MYCESFPLCTRWLLESWWWRVLREAALVRRILAIRGRARQVVSTTSWRRVPFRRAGLFKLHSGGREKLLPISCTQICHFDALFSLFFSSPFFVVAQIAIQILVELHPDGQEVGEDHEQKEVAGHDYHQDRERIDVGEVIVASVINEGVE